MVLEVDKTVFAHTVKGRYNRMHIEALVVEDSAFSRRLMMEAIKEYKRNAVSNGADALRAYALYAPDIVFLDVEMPGVTGLDVLERIMAVDKGAFIVMLTSYTDKDTVENAITRGAKGYIVKPFQRDKILKYMTMCEDYRKIRS